MRTQYSNFELQTLLQSLVVIVDTREKQNQHITDFFIKHKIAFLRQKLDVGDYSVLIPANPSLGIEEDLFLSNLIAIERKSSLDELAANLGNRRQQFENELLRGSGIKIYLMVENGSWDAIQRQAYQSQLSPVAVIGSLKTFEMRYGISVDFIPKSSAGMFVYYTLYYLCREYLLNKSSLIIDC